ncbi:murein biosynthesis integral membrane protein MurJ [Macrococcus carouselicus]|uniref:Probable lipid II flippase MurJ n=1 Tax=Macrococcus carouselicus TaxID=69969 RepID=A0A9Q8FQX5_9STAP|nr:murein biosynthesis integral membrane protein MurJ [Macrococcus carouselicus]TDM03846.1 murein biosynthesis integral membrane protein MurJ [Macrococcus carouselicus]
MKNAVLALMVITILSKIAGYFRDLVLAYYYGASATSDIFLVAYTIPNLAFGIIAAGIATSYIPMLSRIEFEQDKNRGVVFTNQLINILLILVSLMVVIGLIFTGPIVRLFAIGFAGDVLTRAILYARFSIFGLYLILVIKILSEYLNYNKQFNIPSLIGLPLNLILISFIFFSYRLQSDLILASAVLIALMAQLMIVVYFAVRKGFYFKWTFSLKDEYIRRTFKLTLPVIMGASVLELNNLIDRTLASSVTTGGVSALNYANTINVSVIGILVASFVTVFYPEISKKAAQNDYSGLKSSLNQILISVMLLIVPATVVCAFYSTELIGLLYGHGAFEEQAIQLTDSAFLYYSIGMVSAGLNLVLTRVFFALQDTRTPMVNSVYTLLINISLSLILVRFYGLSGITVSTSIAETIAIVLLFIKLNKKIGTIEIGSLIINFLKILVAILVPVIAVKYSLSYTGGPDFSKLLIHLIVIIIIYIYTIVLFKVNYIDYILQLIRKKYLKRG